MGFTFSKPTPIMQDNQSAIALCVSDKHHARVRHFRLAVGLLRDCHLKRITTYPWIPSTDMKGDLFNKVHGPTKHEQLMELNELSPYPITSLDATAKPLVIEGWRERREEEKAAEKENQAKLANKKKVKAMVFAVDKGDIGGFKRRYYGSLLASIQGEC